MIMGGVLGTASFMADDDPITAATKAVAISVPVAEAQPTTAPMSTAEMADDEDEVMTVTTTTTAHCSEAVPTTIQTAVTVPNLESIIREKLQTPIIGQTEQLQTIVSQSIHTQQQQVIQQEVQQEEQKEQTFSSYAKELIEKYERNEFQMKEQTETKEIIQQSLMKLMSSETVQKYYQEHKSEISKFISENKFLSEFLQSQSSKHEFMEQMSKSWQSITSTSKEAWTKFSEAMKKLEQRQTQQVQTQQEQQQQQQQQIKQQEQQQQQTNTTTVEQQTLQNMQWSSQNNTCLEAIISTLSSTQKGSSCRALKIQTNQHHEVRDAIQSLLTPQDKISSPLEYQIAVQNVFNRMYQNICFREHYSEYQKELAAWYRDEGWIRRAPPIPPTKMCPPAKLFQFSRQSPPWLNRMPAYIRAKYYGDSSMRDGQVHISDGNSTRAKLYKLRRKGLLSAEEYAYLMSLKRANDRLLLTGLGPTSGGVLPALVKMLTTWDAPKDPRKPGMQPTVQPLNQLWPKMGRTSSASFAALIINPQVL